MPPLMTYYDRILSEGTILALPMQIGTGGERRKFYFRLDQVELPNDVKEFSLGSATAQAAAGTGSNEIQDSSNNYLLEPEFENSMYQVFFGITPSQAWVYRFYPPNLPINSLVAVRAIGGQVGYVAGYQSRLQYPSPLTEMFTLRGNHPAFLGYAPFLEPASITVRLSFYIVRYDVEFVGVDVSGNGQQDGQRLLVPDEQRVRAVTRSPGSRYVPAPQWVLQAMRSQRAPAPAPIIAPSSGASGR